MLETEVDSPFLAGVIEGFYGQPWSHDTRIAYAEYLKASGLNTYLYCPKSDHHLRKKWFKDWPKSQWGDLKALAHAYTCRGLFWGVGLSPFELYRDYGARQRELLYQKVSRMAELHMPLMAILFDDMPGSLDSLAERQAEIVDDVCQWVPELRVLVCPTYYSFDPVLERHFGARPEHYWPDLGAALPQQVDVFWTGNQVCSETVTCHDLSQAADQLGRPVLLWDNYPVNDGAVRSRYLYTASLSSRELTGCTALRGHLCNPMNQAFLSMPALMGLVRLYGDAAFEESAMAALIGQQCWNQLQLDADDFQSLGLDGLSQQRKTQLASLYAALPGRAAAEVVGWLEGHYAFDPACLTD